MKKGNIGITICGIFNIIVGALLIVSGVLVYAYGFANIKMFELLTSLVDDIHVMYPSVSVIVASVLLGLMFIIIGAISLLNGIKFVSIARSDIRIYRQSVLVVLNYARIQTVAYLFLMIVLVLPTIDMISTIVIEVLLLANVIVTIFCQSIITDTVLPRRESFEINVEEASKPVLSKKNRLFSIGDEIKEGKEYSRRLADLITQRTSGYISEEQFTEFKAQLDEEYEIK